jgi:hypothetical protein
MRISWYQQSSKNTYDITQFVSTINWSGSASQASRQLSMTVLYSPLDNNLKDINIGIGDRIKLYYDDNSLLIDAMVYTRERVTQQGTISYSCYDDLNLLIKSSASYNFRNTTPEKITETVCNDFKISLGSLSTANIHISKLLVEGESIYNIIMKAYTKAYQANGKKYMPIMIGRKLHVIEKGTIIDNYSLHEDYNITSSNYSESLDSMINRVKIYNENGSQIDEVKNDSWTNKYGVFQAVLQKEEGVNPVLAAKAMLQGINQEASLEALGDIRCISGYGVKIKDSVTNLSGKFWIESDSHSWQNGVHTMSLDLAFKNLMDIQEVGNE